MIVSGEGHLVCGRCRNCMAGRRHLCAHTRGVGVNHPGAFAELIALPMTNIWHHAPGVDLDVAAIFDPFGNAVHTALHFPVLGEDVLITGAGPIGLMAAAIVRHAGARYVVVTDLNAYRLDARPEDGRRPRARRAHARRSPTVQRELGMTEGFDIGLEMSGNAGRAARHDREHGPRRPDRDARDPDRGDLARLHDDRLQHAHDQRDLRPRDVRDVVRDDRRCSSPGSTSAPSSPTASTSPSTSRRLRRAASGNAGKVDPQLGGVCRCSVDRPQSSSPPSSTQIRGEGLFKEERLIDSPAGRPRAASRAAARSSTSARTTTSASPTIPR